ncbi:MAG: Tad domain-containing protein, partial [Armatimonadetes bacterium]|nr:Tad domain-containing protein [Armatimonadota bacterium]
MTHRTESGQSLILLAAALTALLGFMSLAIDAGRWFVARQRVVNVCDMAALGGAMELTNDPNTCARAQRAVLTVVDANAGATLVSVSHIIGPDNPDIIISHYNDTTLTNRALSANIQWTDTLGNPVPRPAPNRGLIVRGRIGVPPVFGRVIGYSSPREVGGRTAVVLGQASTIIGGILPFGVSKDHIADIESSPAATIEQVLTYRTWNESWAGAPGAFGTLGPASTPGSTSADDLQ